MLFIMGICYHCGKEVDPPIRCPHCNLTFCPEHMPQKEHNCIALSRNLTGVQPQPVTKTIHYVEPEEEEETPRPRPRSVKTKKSTSFLGEGITRRKVIVVALTLVISLGSILMLGQWQPDPDTPNVGPVRPISQETIKHQEYALSLINEERAKEEIQVALCIICSNDHSCCFNNPCCWQLHLQLLYKKPELWRGWCYAYMDT